MRLISDESYSALEKKKTASCKPFQNLPSSQSCVALILSWLTGVHTVLLKRPRAPGGELCRVTNQVPLSCDWNSAEPGSRWVANTTEDLKWGARGPTALRGGKSVGTTWLSASGQPEAPYSDPPSSR